MGRNAASSVVVGAGDRHRDPCRPSRRGYIMGLMSWK
jgi:hypothetical protein